MAGLTKTKSDVLPFPNLTKNPKELPLAYSKGSGGFLILTNNTTLSAPTSSAFWGNDGFTRMGNYNTLNSTDTDLTILDISNSTKPIIVGNILTRYPNNSSATSTFKITVDGILHTFTHTHVLSSQICLGHTTNRAQNSGTSSASGRGLRFGKFEDYYGSTGASGSGYSLGTAAVIEDAYDLYTNGYPVLYAEHSMQVIVSTSHVYDATYWRYTGVTWRYVQ